MDDPHLNAILDELRGRADPAAVAGMARYGINPANALGGSSMPHLRQMARRYRGDHALAQALWESGLHEARILAALIDDPRQVTPEQMESWVAGLDSWDTCDQLCAGLFVHTPYAIEKAHAWSARPETFVKRAAFSLMAALAVHAKGLPEAAFLDFLLLIQREAGDERNFVRKAVNWALRQIGKRSPDLNRAAIAAARQILESGPRAARWVASDALRELEGPAVQARLAKEAA